jgi:flagellum-specific peptidoglycan hydrolase FlgJ
MAGSSWKGKTVRAWDKIEKSYDPYRVYDSPEQFADDYIKTIAKAGRYKTAKGAKTPEMFFQFLKIQFMLPIKLCI